MNAVRFVQHVVMYHTDSPNFADSIHVSCYQTFKFVFTKNVVFTAIVEEKVSFCVPCNHFGGVVANRHLLLTLALNDMSGHFTPKERAAREH